MSVCMPVVSVIVKRPVLPPCAADGCSRNPLYYYYGVIQKFICHTRIYHPPQNCVTCNGVIQQLSVPGIHPHRPQTVTWSSLQNYTHTQPPTQSSKLSPEVVSYRGSHVDIMPYPFVHETIKWRSITHRFTLCVSFRPCKELPMFITCPTHLNTHRNCPQHHVILSGVVLSFQCS